MAEKNAEMMGLTDIQNSGNHTVLVTPAARPTRRPFMQRLQKNAYLFLEWPSTASSIIYHVLLSAACLIVFALAISMTEPSFKHYTVVGAVGDTNNDSLRRKLASALVVSEIIVQLWIFLDFTIRFWSSSCRRRFQGWRGNLRFWTQFLSIIDALVIFLGFFILTLGLKTYGKKTEETRNDYLYDEYSDYPEEINVIDPGHKGFSNDGLLALLFVQMFRLFKITRIFGGSRLIVTVIWDHRQILLTVLQIGSFLYFFFAYVVYTCEMHHKATHFHSYPDAIYWALITLTTVGYGDTRPLSPVGKAFSCLTAICGVVIYILLPVLLGVGVILKHKELKSLNERSRGPAASLIQSKWRIRRGGVRNHNIVGSILFMKLLAAQKKFRDVKKSSGAGFTQKTSENSHELICALESRMILVEKSMGSVLTKLDQLLESRN